MNRSKRAAITLSKSNTGCTKALLTDDAKGAREVVLTPWITVSISGFLQGYTMPAVMVWGEHITQMSYHLLDGEKSQGVFKCISFKKQLEVFRANLSFGDHLQIHHVLSSEKKEAGSAFYSQFCKGSANCFLFSPQQGLTLGQNFQSTSRD